MLRKKLFISIYLFTLFQAASFSQTEQGVFRIGGDISYDHHGSGNIKENLMETRLQPSLFVGQDILIGVNVGVDKYWAYNSNELSDVKTEIKIGPDVT